ncbi:MAG: cation diffusion facilitator family transporter, partial [Fretibacterium sp.]
LMAYLGISILVRGVRSLGRTDFRVPSAGEFAAVAGTLLLNILTAWLEDRAGRRLNSSILRSDARHTLSDIFVTCGVLVSMALIIFFGAPAWVDSAVSAAIALVIFGSAYRIFREASDELTDHIAVDPREIEAIVRTDPDVRGVHKIRSRRSGDMIYADFHVQCDPEMPLREVHALTHRLEALLNERLEARISCVIHPEAERRSGRND